MVLIAVRRVAVKEISRGCTGWPARLPLVAGVACWAATRPTARTSSVAVIQAACSCLIRAGDCDRKIGPLEGPAPVMEDLASLRAVSDPSHRHRYAPARPSAG